MEHKPLRDMKDAANVIPFAPDSKEYKRTLRRARLHRFADVLEQHPGVIRLLSRIEYLPERERLRARVDQSPLTIAFSDPVLRAQGLAGDSLGDAIAFFDISPAQAHDLVCDCHYPGAGTATSKLIAARARSIANRMTLGEMWGKVRSFAGF